MTQGKPIILAPAPRREIQTRIEKLHAALNAQNNDWDAAFIVDKANQYYLTGTMQEGVFVLKKDGSHAYFARRSFERAKRECLLGDVYPMVSYKDVLEMTGENIQRLYIEADVMPLAMFGRIKKYFNAAQELPIDKIMLKLRAVKSGYELAQMEEAGARHGYLLDSVVPGLLKEGMSEAEFIADLYSEMVKLGHHGATRFAMFQAEVVTGQLGFGENSIYPTSFNGPGGMKGQCPAAPMIGDWGRTLKKGDLVFVDVGFGFNGYHTDRTQIYFFGANPSDEIVRIHRQCMRIQKRIAAFLKPGGMPGEIYRAVMGDLSPEFTRGFMGCEGSVKFLGHGVGLQIDEFPVIAEGFDEPLVENMAIALEPKKALKNVGLLGVEDTYIVTGSGGRCITGGEKDIMAVGS